MLKAIHCDTHEHIFRHLTSLEQANDVRETPHALLWLDLQSPSEQELAKLGHEFKLHPLAIEDASREHQRPKLEEYESFYFVVFYSVGLHANTLELDICELDMFLGKNYLITVHNGHIYELDEVEQRWTRNVKQLEWGVGVLPLKYRFFAGPASEAEGANAIHICSNGFSGRFIGSLSKKPILERGVLLYTLLDTIVDRYFPVVDQLVDQAEELEDRLFTGAVRQATITQNLLELRKGFLALRRIATPERDVLNILTNRDNPIFDEHALVYFRDVYDHITRLADTIDLYRDQLATTMDANLSIVSNDLNKVMRTLTSASIILMVDSLLAGIWGMNFVNIPELRLHNGYYEALALMAAVSILLLLFFKRLRWF